MTEYTKQTILDLIPHRPPFLFVDEIREWDEKKIITAYRFKETEFFFQGHYPEHPIVPGVILCESAMQAGAVFLSDLFRRAAEEDADGKKKVPVVGRIEDVKFKKIITPGDEIECQVSLKEKMGHVFFMNAKITSDGQLAAKFCFACTQAEA